MNTRTADVTSLVPNAPLDLLTLEALLSDRDELFLVWPDARFPFDREQWRETLLSRDGNRSYFIALDGNKIGHAALLRTDESQTLAVSFLYIRAEQRGRGFGRELMALLEAEGRKLGARALRLRVRSYNPRASHVYESSGFAMSDQDGALITMRKSLSG
jgi:ribosomal-protein-alanine N-acetyltransferase